LKKEYRNQTLAKQLQSSDTMSNSATVLLYLLLEQAPTRGKRKAGIQNERMNLQMIAILFHRKNYTESFSNELQNGISNYIYTTMYITASNRIITTSN